MPSSSYVFLRPDTGNYFFRWSVPVAVRAFLDGRREIKRSLYTTDRRLALWLARRLAVMLDRATFELMQTRRNSAPQDGACFNLFAKSVERLVDGILRIEGLQMKADPEYAEEERRLLATLLGLKQDSASAPADAYTLKQLVADYLTAQCRSSSSGRTTRCARCRSSCQADSCSARSRAVPGRW
jgi:hypothetical protein